jgi:hypothetical protein
MWPVKQGLSGGTSREGGPGSPIWEVGSVVLCNAEGPDPDPLQERILDVLVGGGNRNRRVAATGGLLGFDQEARERIATT